MLNAECIYAAPVTYFKVHLELMTAKQIAQNNILDKLHPFWGWQIICELTLITLNLFVVHKYSPISFNE